MSTINLFEKFSLNDTITLKNRIVMAPMTRNAADDDLNPTAEMAAYYARRAQAGLIISEGTIIRPDGRGYSNVPGIFTRAQIKAWQQVTQQVHHNGGLIFLQIWHVGRVSHPHFLNGELPLSASATAMTGKVNRTDSLQYGPARAASLTEIQSLIDSYASAASNAIQAGFDGVEIHGANGYLIDQFLHHATNKRQDQYGGSIENMARFALDVVNACGQAIGYERVGLRLSPGAYLNEITGEAADGDVFTYLLKTLSDLSLAYVHTGNFDDSTLFAELGHQTMTAFIRQHYQGNVIASGSYNLDKAQAGINNKDFDLIAMGRDFIANPDLISKLENKQTLIEYHNEMLETLY